MRTTVLMELLALHASIVSPLDACSSRSARVVASSSWPPHEVECFRSPQQQPARGGRVVLKNLKFSNQLQFRGGRQRQQRKLRSRRMIVCCEAAPDFDDAKKTQSAQLYGQIERYRTFLQIPCSFMISRKNELEDSRRPWLVSLNFMFPDRIQRETAWNLTYFRAHSCSWDLCWLKLEFVRNSKHVDQSSEMGISTVVQSQLVMRFHTIVLLVVGLLVEWEWTRFTSIFFNFYSVFCTTVCGTHEPCCLCVAPQDAEVRDLVYGMWGKIL